MMDVVNLIDSHFKPSYMVHIVTLLDCYSSRLFHDARRGKGIIKNHPNVLTEPLYLT